MGRCGGGGGADVGNRWGGAEVGKGGGDALKCVGAGVAGPLLDTYGWVCGCPAAPVGLRWLGVDVNGPTGGRIIGSVMARLAAEAISMAL